MKCGEEWSSSGPRSVSPFVPCAADRIPVVLAAARLREEDVVYDLGCGDGRILHQAAAVYGCRCVGLDIDADCIRVAREQASAIGVGDRCSFHVCDLLKLPPGALVEGDLGQSTDADSQAAVPPATCAIIFITSHGLTRLEPFLRQEWLTSPSLRLVTCVEALDSLFDFQSENPLFGEEDGQSPCWPISRAHARSGVFVVPPRSTTVHVWEEAGDVAPTPLPTPAEADGTTGEVMRALLTAREMLEITCLGEAMMGAGEQSPAEDEAIVDLFGAPSEVGAANSEWEDAYHGRGAHRIVHLHRGGEAQHRLSLMVEKVLNRIRLADRSRWGLLANRPVGVRSIEYHRYSPGGSVADPDHRDSGSILTLSALLSDPSTYQGGKLVFPGAKEGPAFQPPLGCGDAVLFVSERRHNVEQLTSGERRVLVIELWPGATNRHNRHR